MPSAPKIINSDSDAIREYDAHVKEYTRRANTLIMQIPKYFTDAFDGAASKIKNLSETLENFVDHQTFVQVHQGMSEARNAAFDSFFTNFANLITNANAGAELDAERALNFHTNDLCLITDSELEHQLRLESGFHSAMEGFEKMLIDSSWRFHHELKELKLDGMIDSVRPGRIAQLIHHSLDTTIKDRQTARVVHRYIGWDIYSHLYSLYHSLTPLLYDVCNLMQQTIAKSFMVELQDQMQAQPLAEVKSEPRVDVSGLINNWDTPPVMEVNYIDDGLSLTDINIPENTEVNTLKADELSDLLKNLSVEGKSFDNDGVTPQELRTALKSSLQHLSSEGILTVIDRVSENIVNLVSGFFANITSNNDFVPEVALQITRIQIPIMRLSLSNSLVFQQEDHAARRYIDTLGNLGVRISCTSEEGYFALRDSVDRVIHQFDGEESFFDNELQTITSYIENSVYGVKWAAEMLDLPDEDNKQNRHVKKFLEAQSALLSRELTFHKMLRFIWSEILNRIAQKNGIYSEKWRESVELYSGILWSTQADASDIGKREVLRRLPSIVQGVKQTVAEQNLHPRVRDEVLNQMIQIHLSIIRGTPGAEIEDAQIANLDVFNSLQGDVFLPEAEEEIDAEALELARVEPVIQPVIRPEDASPNMYWRFDQISPFEDKEDAVDAEQEAASHDEPKSLVEVSSAVEALTFEAENEEEWSTVGAITGDQEMKRLFKLVGGMSVGSVIEFNSKGKRRRWQLVKKSVSLGQYTFRSFDSNEFTSLSKAQLVIAFIRGEAKRLGERSLFENSLESAVGAIQRR